jgi:chemotaxis response regulator CheB
MFFCKERKRKKTEQNKKKSNLLSQSRNNKQHKMNSVYRICVRRFSTQQNHFKLVVIGAGCGGLACASKFAKKLPKNEIAIVDKNDVCCNRNLISLFLLL